MLNSEERQGKHLKMRQYFTKPVELLQKMINIYVSSPVINDRFVYRKYVVEVHMPYMKQVLDPCKSNQNWNRSPHTVAPYLPTLFGHPQSEVTFWATDFIRLESNKQSPHLKLSPRSGPVLYRFVSWNMLQFRLLSWTLCDTWVSNLHLSPPAPWNWFAELKQSSETIKVFGLF